MKRFKIVTGEYYHVFNRGFEKKEIFCSGHDFTRFLQSMDEFNSADPIGSIYQQSFAKNKLGARRTKKRLVDFVCYCINPNHFHFLLKQTMDKGIEKFMQKLGAGYTRYFNLKHKRQGYLFQGPYKLVHIDSNEYLLHLSVYINLNNNVHKLGAGSTKSSWEEYIAGKEKGFCEKEIVLSQFKNVVEYKNFAEQSLGSIIEQKNMKNYVIE